MKTTQKPQSITENKLMIAFDISKDKLNCYSEYPSSDKTRVNCIKDAFCNRTDTIKSKLNHWVRLSEDGEYDGIHIVAEATSVYHRKLFRMAHTMGITTSLVNTESVSKLKVVESNDSGKTDQKDPRIIFTLARLGKTLTHRQISSEYALLRQWNKIIFDLDKKLVALRCQLHTIVSELFCDYTFNKDFLYNTSGQALVYVYGANPYKIIDDDYTVFVEKMKGEVPRIKAKTLKQLYTEAEMSVQHCLSTEYTDILSLQVKMAMADWKFRV